MMKHYNSYNLRKKILTKEFSILFYNYFYIDFKYCRMFKRENKIFAFNFIEKAVEWKKTEKNYEQIRIIQRI